MVSDIRCLLDCITLTYYRRDFKEIDVQKMNKCIGVRKLVSSVYNTLDESELSEGTKGDFQVYYIYLYLQYHFAVYCS